MAAADGPDPRHLESWEDAFQHSVPAVRGMEKKLRNGVLENQEKLRNLVGVSYRDLLGTARTIINADKQMQEVEKLLVDVGKSCDSRILDKIASNHSRLESYNASRQSGQYAVASQLWVLQKCLAVISRLLRTHGSTLLTAKLLVVSRLLHKTLSSLTDASAANDIFGNRLGSLRQKLLKHIDRRFESSYAELPTLVEDMTAFSLATSSSPSDVLRHFQHLRLDVIKRPLQGEKRRVKASIVNRLQIYLDTQRETRAIYPELLQASLRTLSARSLLEDSDVRAIDELGLDNNLQWIASEVKYFTPWTRHDELQKSKTSQSLSTWAKDGLKALMQRLGDDISLESDMESLADMRTEQVQMWLSNRHHASGVPSREVLREIRAQFASRLNQFIEESFNNLYTQITQPISTTLEKWEPRSDAAKSPWVSSTLSMEIGRGATEFRDVVINQRSGRSKSIIQVLNAFESRVKDADTVQSVIKQMREARWDDDQDFSDSDEEDDQSPSTYHVLSRDDPNEMQNCLRENAVTFARNLEAFFTANISAEALDCGRPTAPGIYVLRLVRELRRRVPLLLQNIDKEAAQHLICAGIVSKLHISAATSIQTKSSVAFVTALDDYVNSRLNVQSLWEGTSPPLPVQITTATFKTLHSTVKDMEALGSDLWTTGALVALRSALDDAFGKALTDTIAKLDNLSDNFTKKHTSMSPHANGVAPDGDSSENEQAILKGREEPTALDGSGALSASDEPDKSLAEVDEPHAETPAADFSRSDAQTREDLIKAKATQLLFDAIYLYNALSLPSAPPDPANLLALANESEKTAGGSLIHAIASLARRANFEGHSNDTPRATATATVRLSKAAADYWRRTYLLFGLLSCP